MFPGHNRGEAGDTNRMHTRRSWGRLWAVVRVRRELDAIGAELRVDQHVCGVLASGDVFPMFLRGRHTNIKAVVPEISPRIFGD